MNDQICPECGCELPDDAPRGFCPECLFRQGLSEDHEVPPELAATTPQPVDRGAFTPPAPEDLAPHFPQLEILQLLGRGGMGAVYQARQTKLDRLVALKVIRPEVADDPTFAERFTREARTLARLTHRGVVGVHDFGEVTWSGDSDQGDRQTLYFFVMEFVDGVDLRELMDAGSLDANQAMAIVPQVCEALEYAHNQGVVHRDIKPENILVDREGRVKIADFGLARLIEMPEHDFTLTATHQVVGTPRYMSPEQMSGARTVDHRADIYSLGVVFYELLTGEVPMGQFDPPSKRSGVDARLDEVVLRALAREPDRRFQSAGEMQSQVECISSVGSSIGNMEVPARGGPSAIMEREIAAVWRWVAGDGDTNSKRTPEAPAALIFAMAVAGCLSILLPWMDVTLHTATGELVESQTLLGTSHFLGTYVAIAYAIVGLLVMATPREGRRSVWWATLLLIIAAFTTSFTLGFRAEAQKADFSSLRTSEPADSPLAKIGEVMPHPGFHLSLAMSIGLMLLGATGIRHGFSNRSRAETPPPKPVGHERPRAAAPDRSFGGWKGAADQPVLAAAALPLQADRDVPKSAHDRPLAHHEAVSHPLPRATFSRKAIVGAIFASIGLLGLPLFLIPTSYAMRRADMPAGAQVGPAIWALALLTPVLIAPFASTILGFIAMSDIRRSNGRIVGLGLAFVDAVIFPTIVLTGFITIAVGALAWPDDRLITVLSVAPAVLIVAVLILRSFWKSVNRPLFPPMDEEPPNHSHESSSGLMWLWWIACLVLFVVFPIAVGLWNDGEATPATPEARIDREPIVRPIEEVSPTRVIPQTYDSPTEP